jgi:hypothetical protein
MGNSQAIFCVLPARVLLVISSWKLGTPIASLLPEASRECHKPY